MISRDLEGQLASWISSSSTGTDLAGINVRHAVPEDPLSYPCAIVVAASSELLEGGVRSASKVSLDVSVVSAANEGDGWQTAHKDRVAALARLLDDTNTSAALASINAAQSGFTLYGWSCVELSSETAPNHQIDGIRISAVAGDRSVSQPLGTTSASPQDYSLRHELETLVAAHLVEVLDSPVTEAYDVVPSYREDAAPAARIVASCKSANRTFPQHPRWAAQMSVAVVTPAEAATGHDEAVEAVQSAIRGLVAQDFTSSDVTIAGLLESGHTSDKSDKHIWDTLGFVLHCQQN